MQTTQLPAVPASVESKLRSIRARQLGIGMATAAALATSVLLVSAVASMLADRWLLFSAPGTRLLVTAVTLAIAGLALATKLQSLLRSTMRKERTAAFVDRRVPELEERWSTVTRLESAVVSPSSTGQAMATQVSREAATMESLVKLPHVAPTDGLRRSLVVLGICSLGMLAFLAMDWSLHTSLLQRLLAPTSAHPLTTIEQVSGDVVVARGERLSLEAEASGWTSRRAMLWMQDEDGETTRIQLPMEVGSSGAMRHEIESVENSFRYYVRVGDATTDWHDVKVVDPPEIGGVAFSIRPPAYTREPAYEREEIPRRVKARSGSQLDLAVRVDSLETSAELQIVAGADSSETRTILLTGDTDVWKRCRVRLQDNVSFRVVLKNTWGLTNVDPPKCRVTVIPDRPPIARVLSGGDEVAVRPDEVIDIRFEALDDIGIAKAELIVYDDSNVDENGELSVLAVQEIDLEEQTLARRVVVDTELDLAEFDVADGDSISYSIRVADSRLADFESRQETLPPGDGSEAATSHSDGSMQQPMVGGAAGDEAGRQTGTPAGGLAASDADNMGPSDAAGGPSAPGDSPPTGAAEGQPSTSEPQLAAGGTPVPADGSLSSDSPGELGPIGLGGVAARSSPRRSATNQEMAAGLGDPELLDEDFSQLAIDAADASAESHRQRLVVDTSLRSFGGRDFARLRAKIAAEFDQLGESLLQNEFDLVEMREDLTGADRLSANHLAELRGVDVELEDVELMIGNMRRLTSGTPYGFVGKGVVDIGVADVSPARDSIVSTLQARGAAGPSEVTSASDRVVSARERLDALRERYDAVAREHALAESIERVRKMFGSYITNAMQLLGEGQQDFDPLEWNIDGEQYDEEYRRRLAEVLKLRRELLAELSRMLSSDPRLLRRFMAMNQRRQTSLHEELRRLARWQAEMAAELQAWNRFANRSQLREVWTVVTERRLDSVVQLQQAIDAMERRINTSLPLAVKLEDAAAKKLLSAAKEASSSARSMVESLRKRGASTGSPEQAAKRIYRDLEELNAYVAAFADEHGEPATEFAANRRNEINVLLARTADWVNQTELFEKREYHALAGPEQARLTSETELLAEEMEAAVQNLDGFFEGEIPDDVVQAGGQLAAAFQPLILNQTAAGFALQDGQLAPAGAQQQKALEGFKSTEEAFNQLWAVLRKHESERDIQLPDLQDPTLDQILELLEREPSLERLLGMRLGPLGFGFLGFGGWADAFYSRGDTWGAGYRSAMDRAVRARLFAGPEMRRNPLASQLEEAMWQVQSQLPPEEFRKAIEQYFDQVRRLTAPEADDTDQ